MKLNLILHIIKKLLKDKMTSEVAYFYNGAISLVYFCVGINHLLKRLLFDCNVEYFPLEYR